MSRKSTRAYTPAAPAMSGNVATLQAQLLEMQKQFAALQDSTKKAAATQSAGLPAIKPFHVGVTAAGVKMIAFVRLDDAGQPLRKKKDQSQHDHAWIMPNAVRDLVRLMHAHPAEFKAALVEAETE